MRRALFTLCLVGCTTSTEVGRFNDQGTGGSGGGGGEGGSAHLEPAHTRLSASYGSSCAIASSGGVVCWGDNDVGQLGTGSAAPDMSSTPLPVFGLESGVRALFGGTVAHCALLLSGQVSCWGDSVFGVQDGVPKHEITYAPVAAPGLSQIASMGIGTYFHCALDVDGYVQCYGLNSAGQLGSGSLDDSYLPVAVPGLEPHARQIAGSQSGFFACAVTTGGAARCWGSNALGQLGTGSPQDETQPAQVLGLDHDVTAIITGRDHACAVVSQAVKCWGSNLEGQLGTGTYDDEATPVDVLGLPPIVALAAGAVHTCALSIDGALHCWGSYLTENAANEPALVIASGVQEVTAAGRHSCALLDGNVLRCWGLGDAGQLGPFEGDGAPL